MRQKYDKCCKDAGRFLRAGYFPAIRADHKCGPHDGERSTQSVHPIEPDKIDQCPLLDFETTVHKCLHRHPTTRYGLEPVIMSIFSLSLASSSSIHLV